MTNTPTLDTIIASIERAKGIGNYKKALTLALNGLKSYTDEYQLYEELADIYLFQKNIEKAEEVIQYARELHPESGTGLYLEGYILAEKGDFDQAIEILNHANTIFPNNAEILRNIGWCYVMQGEITKGLAHMRRALALAPDDVKILQNLSNALLIAEGTPEKPTE